MGAMKTVQRRYSTTSLDIQVPDTASILESGSDAFPRLTSIQTRSRQSARGFHRCPIRPARGITSSSHSTMVSRAQRPTATSSPS
jgi:hypothetical protein